MFFARYLSILGGGVEALVSKVHLKHPETVPRVILFYSHGGECISQFMRRNIVHSPRFWIDEFRQPSLFGALLDHLPRAMPIYSENQSFPVPYHRTTPFNIFSERVESLPVDWQDSLAPVLLLFDFTLLYPAAALRAKDMSGPKSRSAHMARKPDATL